MCAVNDGFDRRFHDSAARQFHQQVVADLVLGFLGTAESFNVVRRCCSFRMLRPMLRIYLSGDDEAVDVDTRAVSACVGVEGA
jgi:hypothetical protein